MPPLLRQMRQQADFSQRALGDRLDRPQSWIYNCESGYRRVDITEFINWCRACEADPKQMLNKLLKLMGAQK